MTYSLGYYLHMNIVSLLLPHPVYLSELLYQSMCCLKTHKENLNVRNKDNLPQEGPRWSWLCDPALLSVTRGNRLPRRAGGDTHLHVGTLRLQELADHLAQLVGVRELPRGGQLRPAGVLGGRARVTGVHLARTVAGRGPLFRALQSKGKGQGRLGQLALTRATCPASVPPQCPSRP